jgi:hypothetical protein
MKITAMYLYFLLIFLSSNAFAEKIEFTGVEAESVFTRFLENYKSKTKKSLIYGIPVHGNNRTILKCMLIVHAAKSIDPNSIDRLLMIYKLDPYALQCKKLYLSMLSELSHYDRIIPSKVIIETNRKGAILELQAESYGNKKGRMLLGSQYFKDVHIHIHDLSVVTAGGRQ